MSSTLNHDNTANKPRWRTPALTRTNHYRITSRSLLALVTLALCVYLTSFWDRNPFRQPTDSDVRVKAYRKATLEKCKYITTPAGPPPDFSRRTHSDRFVPGTKPVLLKNAKIWTGARNGTEIVYGDVLLDKGLIQAVGYIPPKLLRSDVAIQVHDIQGAWITPGLVDLHSHIGVSSHPRLSGARDMNSLMAPIVPWVRSIDALNTHDASYELAISGGLTTAQILPGSSDNIGGQAFVIKLRSTSERSTTSKVLEPPYTLNGTFFDHSLTPRWRHMKHACGERQSAFPHLDVVKPSVTGENPNRNYQQTRMDAVWNFRKAYNEARDIKDAQDTFCSKAKAGFWHGLGDFPENLQWESLVDVLRGKVKVSVHCYEAVDLDGIVRLSNEFKFPIASFHHAGETYLVPDLLKKAWGGTPSVALFASFFKMKREAYRGSEFAPRILADHGIPVVMKSDHPVINSRYLLHEAAQAHYYGLNPALALASVTSTPADAAGLGHRIGTIREGYDADIVVYDSHPLALGSTPTQVYIDGIPQLSSPYNSTKPESHQVLPKTPSFDGEAVDAVKYDGVPPLDGRKSRHVAFEKVKSLYIRTKDKVEMVFDEMSPDQWRTVVVRDGNIVCNSSRRSCASSMVKAEVVDLNGGSLAPGLTSFGSPLGLVEMRLEPSTNDGPIFDPLTQDVPSIIGGDDAIVRAVDGLQFGGRNTLLAYRAGVTTAITAPFGEGFLRGISAAFATSASNALEKGAIIQADTAVHIAVQHGSAVSVSTQITTLRRLLFDANFASQNRNLTNTAFSRVLDGSAPLVVHVGNADIMATLLSLKHSYDKTSSQTLRLTFAGASEAHLLADEIAQAGVSVILIPSRPFPAYWDQRRILPGPPLSYDSAVTKLLEKGVNVGIGVVYEAFARNTRFDIAWAALESNGRIDMSQAIALASSNLERALGLEMAESDLHKLVAYFGGGILDMQSKPVGVILPQQGAVDLF